ncbi:VUT family protein [Geopsychrobacter electrodiphilus]|uniref:VUT family protein n=1 Tax=Geopsychrobacter electrodiphilus TaxID=225196 RepID=UPI000380CB09|nr:VUT family protein [Geopsychrobacter electrodiphilus]
MSAAFYLGSIILANILVHTLGIVTVLGVTFPAGAVAVGLTFSARDFVQDRYGKFGCWGWMLVASGITFAFNQQLALASVCAFGVAETSDWLIYSGTRGSFEKRMILSNLISTPLDSLVFVLLAFGPLWPAIWGQALIKMLSSLLVLPLFKNGKIRTLHLSVQRG